MVHRTVVQGVAAAGGHAGLTSGSTANYTGAYGGNAYGGGGSASAHSALAASGRLPQGGLAGLGVTNGALSSSTSSSMSNALPDRTTGQQPVPG